MIFNNKYRIRRVRKPVNIRNKTFHRRTLKFGETYNDCVFRKCKNHGATVVNSQWYNGVWYYGEWIGGDWYSGTWEGNLKVIDGKLESCSWKIGRWHNGVWKGGFWRDGVWFNGLWENGTFWDGTWHDGIWEDGDWIGGLWKDKNDNWLNRRKQKEYIEEDETVKKNKSLFKKLFNRKED